MLFGYARNYFNDTMYIKTLEKFHRRQRKKYLFVNVEHTKVILIYQIWSFVRSWKFLKENIVPTFFGAMFSLVSYVIRKLLRSINHLNSQSCNFLATCKYLPSSAPICFIIVIKMSHLVPTPQWIWIFNLVLFMCF